MSDLVQSGSLKTPDMLLTPEALPRSDLSPETQTRTSTGRLSVLSWLRSFSKTAGLKPNSLRLPPRFSAQREQSPPAAGVPPQACARHHDSHQPRSRPCLGQMASRLTRVTARCSRLTSVPTHPSHPGRFHPAASRVTSHSKHQTG